MCKGSGCRGLVRSSVKRITAFLSAVANSQLLEKKESPPTAKNSQAVGLVENMSFFSTQKSVLCVAFFAVNIYGFSSVIRTDTNYCIFFFLLQKGARQSIKNTKFIVHLFVFIRY